MTMLDLSARPAVQSSLACLRRSSSSHLALLRDPEDVDSYVGGAVPRRREANVAATTRDELYVRERLLTSGPLAPGGDLSRTAEPQCWHPGERLRYRSRASKASSRVEVQGVPELRTPWAPRSSVRRADSRQKYRLSATLPQEAPESERRRQGFVLPRAEGFQPIRLDADRCPSSSRRPGSSQLR